MIQVVLRSMYSVTLVAVVAESFVPTIATEKLAISMFL